MLKIISKLKEKVSEKKVNIGTLEGCNDNKEEKDNYILLCDEQKELLKKLKARVIAFSEISKKYKNKSFCIEAVKINGYMIMYMQDDILDLDICIEAVRNKDRAIKYVPDRFVRGVQDKLSINIEMNKEPEVDIDDEPSIKELMEEHLPGKSVPKSSDDNLSDGGSLYDQFEYIKDNL